MSKTTVQRRQCAAFGRILLCVDATEDRADAASLVTALADADSKVRVLGLLENTRATIPNAPLAFFNLSAAHANLRRRVEACMRAARTTVHDAALDVDEQIEDMFERGGDAAHALTHAALNWRADLIVLSSRQQRAVLGWTERAARDVTSTLSCSILSLPERSARKTLGRPRRILCAVDGSLASFEALRAGFKIAAPNACVRCVYVLDRAARAEESVTTASVQDAFLEEGHGALRKAQIVFAQSWNASDFKFDTTIVETEQSGDDVAHAILRQAAEWQADAIIMGTHGQRGVARWILGSVSGRVSVLTDLPLLLTRRHLADA